MRIIGMDIHRVAAEVVSLLDGEIVKLGRVQMLRNKLEEFARKELAHDDHVVIEAMGNAAAVAATSGALAIRRGSSPMLASTRACGSPVKVRPIMDA